MSDTKAALAARMNEARKHQWRRYVYRAQYTGNRISNSRSMLEAIIHRRGNRRDYGYSWSPGWSTVTVSRGGVGAWEVLPSSDSGELNLYFCTRPDRVDRHICAIQKWLGRQWRIIEISEERRNREFAEAMSGE